MKVAGTDNTGYMPIHRKCLVKLNTKKLDCVRELKALPTAQPWTILEEGDSLTGPLNA